MVIISLYLRINKAHNGLLSINGAEFKCGSYYNTCSARFRLGLFGVSLEKLRDWCWKPVVLTSQTAAPPDLSAAADPQNDFKSQRYLGEQLSLAQRISKMKMREVIEIYCDV